MPAPFEGVKPWWKSKGVIGGAVAAVVGIFGLVRPSVAAHVSALQPEIVDTLLLFAASIAGVVAIIGRLTATDVLE